MESIFTGFAKFLRNNFLPAFNVSFSDPLVGDLTTDGREVMGEFTIFPGLKVDGVGGSEVTIGGVKRSVTLKDGTASFGCSINILNTSFTFSKDEKLDLQASVESDNFLWPAFKLTGSVTTESLQFDPNDSNTLARLANVGGSITGSVIVKEHILFKDAGILTSFNFLFVNCRGLRFFYADWVDKVTVTVKATLDTSETVTLTRSLEWELKPILRCACYEPNLEKIKIPHLQLEKIKIPHLQLEKIKIPHLEKIIASYKLNSRDTLLASETQSFGILSHELILPVMAISIMAISSPVMLCVAMVEAVPVQIGVQVGVGVATEVIRYLFLR